VPRSGPDRAAAPARVAPALGVLGSAAASASAIIRLCAVATIAEDSWSAAWTRCSRARARSRPLRCVHGTVTPAPAIASAPRVTAALRQWRAEIPGDEPSGSTLWPEHADVAIRAADINYGASPGDEYVAEPYLYVGPPAPPTHSPDGFWNAPFGAYLTWDKVHSVADAVDFFRQGRRLSHG